MRKNYGCPLYELICRASSGEEEAITEILKFYDAYISKLCYVRFTTLKVVKSVCRLMKN
jgi:hypothetical protein